MKRYNFLGYNIYSDDLEKITIDHKLIISTINPYSYLLAEKDKIFKEALLNSDIILPDGVGIVWATRYLKNKKIKKIAGYDLFIHLMHLLEKKNGSCFFFGSTEETLSKIKKKSTKEYPSVKVDYHSPPFKEQFSDKEDREFADIINSFNPDVLFVGITAPKQEKWVFKNKDKLNVPIIVSIGAVFDFYAGNVIRPSQFWISIGLEWLVRFLQEPKRLFKRNLYSILFVIKILKAKFLK